MRRRSRRGARAGLDPALEAAVRAAYERGAPISEAAARLAAEAGSRDAMMVYGIGLGNRGAFAEAEHWLVRAINLGDSTAAIALGTMRMDLGDFGQAESCFRLAATAGHPGAGPALRQLQIRRPARDRSQAAGRPQAPEVSPGPGAEPESRGAPATGDDLAAIRRAADAGHPPAQHDLAHALAERGEAGEAERYYRMAVAGGFTDSLVNLGVLLRQRGDLAGAEECYRRAIAAGDLGASNNLGNLLRQRGDMTGAEECYRVAAEGGNPDALASYGAIHAENGDWARAEELFRRSAEAGNVAGMLNLSQALARRGLAREAAQWLLAARNAQPAPPTSAESLPGERAAADLDAVARWLNGPAADGDPDAQAALDLLRQHDRPPESA